MNQRVFYTAAAGVLMALLVFAGCPGPFDREAGGDSDQPGVVVAQSGAARARPTEPGNDADLARAQAAGGKGNAVKMVPFRGSGTYQYVDFLPDFGNEQIEIVVALEGKVTGLGRFGNAEGWYDFRIKRSADPDATGGIWELEGEISSVESRRQRVEHGGVDQAPRPTA